MSGEVEIETGPGSGAKRAWWRRLSPDAWGWVGLGAFLSVFVWLWFYLGTHLIYQSNQDRLNWDQQHNIAMAFKALDREKQPLQPGETVTEALWRSFPHYTDGVVNPLWPWVAARFATEDHEAFFRRGKWFNLIVTMVFLVALGVVTARAFSLPSAIAVLLLAGLGGMLPRAPYFQPEPIYYILLFLAWAAALSLLRKNHLWLYGLIGGLLGLAYLAKTSVQPFLLVFFGVTLLRTLVAWWTGRRKADRGDSDGWSVPNQFIGLAVLTMAFLAMCGPRLSYANTAFGSPFHSYPGYWMWMDGFEEGSRFMIQYPNRETLEKLSAAEKPSLGNYLRAHSSEVFWERLKSGTLKKLKEVFLPHEVRKPASEPGRGWRQIVPQRGWLVLVEFAGMAAISFLHWRAWRQRDRQIWPVKSQSAFWMLAFTLGVFALSSLAYGFYEPIGKGDRFILSLFLPLVVTLVWIAERFRRQLARTPFARSANAVHFGVQGAVAAVVLWRVTQLLDTPIFR